MYLGLGGETDSGGIGDEITRRLTDKEKIVLDFHYYNYAFCKERRFDACATSTFLSILKDVFDEVNCKKRPWVVQRGRGMAWCGNNLRCGYAGLCENLADLNSIRKFVMLVHFRVWIHQAWRDNTRNFPSRSSILNPFCCKGTLYFSFLKYTWP